MSITIEVICEVIDVLEGVESTGIEIDWLERSMWEIHRVREYHELVQNVNTLRVQAGEMGKQMDCIEYLIKQVEEKMAN